LQIAHTPKKALASLARRPVTPRIQAVLGMGDSQVEPAPSPRVRAVDRDGDPRQLRLMAPAADGGRRRRRDQAAGDGGGNGTQA